MVDLKKKTYIIFLLTIVLLTISICLNFYLYFLREPLLKEVKTEIVKKDTVVTFKKDFDTVYISQTKYNDIYHYDTIHIKDKITNVEKVYIQDTIKNYSFKEKDYDLDINAVKLDNYKLNIHTKDTIKYTETVYQTIYKPKKNLITIGVNVGYGFGFTSKKLEPFIGLGINFNLFNK